MAKQRKPKVVEDGHDGPTNPVQVKRRKVAAYEATLDDEVRRSIELYGA
jgi:hypothetical protein